MSLGEGISLLRTSSTYLFGLIPTDAATSSSVSPTGGRFAGRTSGGHVRSWRERIVPPRRGKRRESNAGPRRSHVVRCQIVRHCCTIQRPPFLFRQYASDGK